MRRYLIVDDNRLLAENLAEVLVGIGAEVVVAADGRSALEEVGRVRFDAMVTDLRMPECSGLELLDQVRRVDPDLPAVVVSAYCSDRELALIADRPQVTVLAKPVPLERLLATLEGVCTTARARGNER